MLGRIGIAVYAWALPWLARLSWRNLRRWIAALAITWCFLGVALTSSFSDYRIFLAVAAAYGLLYSITFLPLAGGTERIVLRTGSLIASFLTVALLTQRIIESDPQDARGFFLFLSALTHWAVALSTLIIAGTFHLVRRLRHRP